MYKIVATPMWFPNKYRILHGIFIKRHLEIIASKNNVAVAFAKGGDSEIETYSLDIKKEDNLLIIICYFKLSKFPVFYRFINVLRFFVAQYKAIRHSVYMLGGVDFFHVHVLTRSAILPFLYEKYKRIPYFISEQSTRYVRENGYTFFLRKKLTQLIVKNSSGVSVISQDLKHGMINHSLKHNNFYVIPNAVDGNRYKSDGIIKTENCTVRFLHVSRMDQQAKNIEGLVSSLRYLQDKYPNIELHMVGGYKIELEKIKNYTELLKLKVNVIFHGILTGNDLIDQFNKADAFVMFSNYETQAVVVTESLFFGIPVIGTKLPALEEYLHSGNSILVEKGDIKALAKAMERFINRIDDFWSKNEIRAEALARFDNEVIFSKFSKFYLPVQ